MPTCLSPIVGLQFRRLEDKAHLATLSAGTELFLDPEPDNSADPNAVRVLSSGFHLGYLPSYSNPRVDFSIYTSNTTILSILAACPNHTAVLAFDLENPLVCLTWKDD